MKTQSKALNHFAYITSLNSFLSSNVKLFETLQTYKHISDINVNEHIKNKKNLNSVLIRRHNIFLFSFEKVEFVTSCIGMYLQ